MDRNDVREASRRRPPIRPGFRRGPERSNRMSSSPDGASLTDSNGRSNLEVRSFESEADPAISGTPNPQQFPMVMTLEQLCA